MYSVYVRYIVYIYMDVWFVGGAKANIVGSRRINNQNATAERIYSSSLAVPEYIFVLFSFPYIFPQR